jgi:hypothetical protein
LQADPDEDNYVGRITEFFQGSDNGSYFSCGWFFRVADTVCAKHILFFFSLEEIQHVSKPNL